MGQTLGRHQMDTGVRMYHSQKHKKAVKRWRLALKCLRGAEDRFITLGYLAQALSESGDFGEMAGVALRQLELADRRDDAYMKAEAYLNLARANQHLAHFDAALAYARCSLQHSSMDPRTPGYAQLCMGDAHLARGDVQAALGAYVAATRVAQRCADALLELQVCVGVGRLFTQTRDLTKAAVFLRNALALLSPGVGDDVQAKYRALVLYHLSVALRHAGALVDAKAAVDEALMLATENGNKPIQARCLCSIADIHRELGELDKSWSRYDAALVAMRTSGDRLGEVTVLASMAKTAAEQRRHDVAPCECRAIQLNKRCLDIATSIGAKLHMLKCYARLNRLYRQLRDDDSVELTGQSITSLVRQLEMFCNFCGQRFGIKDEALQALRCSHVFHQRCLHNRLKDGENNDCPKCLNCAGLDVSTTPTTPYDSQPAVATLTTACPLRLDRDPDRDDVSISDEPQRPYPSSSLHRPSPPPVVPRRSWRMTAAAADDDTPPYYLQDEHTVSDDESEAAGPATDVILLRRHPFSNHHAYNEDRLLTDHHRPSKENGQVAEALEEWCANSPGPSQLAWQQLNNRPTTETCIGVPDSVTFQSMPHTDASHCNGAVNGVPPGSGVPLPPPHQTALLAPLGRYASPTALNFHGDAVNGGWNATDV